MTVGEALDYAVELAALLVGAAVVYQRGYAHAEEKLRIHKSARERCRHEVPRARGSNVRCENYELTGCETRHCADCCVLVCECGVGAAHIAAREPLKEVPPYTTGTR